MWGLVLPPEQDFFENMSPICGCIRIYRAYLWNIWGHIYGNMKQIIVTNVRSGSLTKGSHPPQPDPLDRPCPLTSPHLLPPATLHVLSYTDDCRLWLWIMIVIIFTSNLSGQNYLPHCYHLLLCTFYTMTIADCDGNDGWGSKPWLRSISLLKCRHTTLLVQLFD